MIIVAQIPYRIYRLAQDPKKGISKNWPRFVGNFLIAALIINWVINQLAF